MSLKDLQEDVFTRTTFDCRASLSHFLLVHLLSNLLVANLYLVFIGHFYMQGGAAHLPQYVLFCYGTLPNPAIVCKTWHFCSAITDYSTWDMPAFPKCCRRCLGCFQPTHLHFHEQLCLDGFLSEVYKHKCFVLQTAPLAYHLPFNLGYRIALFLGFASAGIYTFLFQLLHGLRSLATPLGSPLSSVFDTRRPSSLPNSENIVLKYVLWYPVLRRVVFRRFR